MQRCERGLSGSVQVALLLPFVLGTFLLALQWAMLAWAETTAQAAAQDGARAAAAFGSTSEQGHRAALDAAANGSLDDVTVTIHRGATMTSAAVSGKALAVIPLFPVTVESSATAPTERLTRP